MRKIRAVLRVVLCLGLVMGNLNCSVNILENFANKTSNEALYIDALKKMNSGDFDGALAKIALMTGSFPSERKVVTLKASAYAGKCGLSFLSFVEALGGMGTTKLFAFLLSQFQAGGATTKAGYCKTAEDLVESIGVAADRTSDENMLLVLISFAKIGQLLSKYADTDQDGTPDAAYDICTTAGGGAMPDADAAELGTGITLAIQNITAVTSTVDLGDQALNDIQTLCSTLNDIPVPGDGRYNFCSVTDPSSFTANHLLAIRSLAREGSAVGLNLNGCGGGDPTNASCRCF